MMFVFSFTISTVALSANDTAISADYVVTNPGETVDVNINLFNNPGIVSATIKVKYNSSVLSLKKVTDAGMLGIQSHKPEYTSPYTLAWANDTVTSNFTINGTIATLTFKVNDDAEKGKLYPIELSYNYDNYDIYDKDINPIQFDMINGGIFIADSFIILGDTDGDGTVEIRDSTWIQRFAANMDLPFSITKTRSDVDENGYINIMDATAIQYYLANMKTPYKIGEKIE